MERSAVISDDGLYRYYLSRRWGGGKSMVFIMLNPSTADASVDDATIRKCIGFAERANCTAIEVVNLFGFRATKPKDLWLADDPVGPDNLHNVAFALASSKDCIVVCAWGANASNEDSADVRLLLARKGIRAKCLGVTSGGQPRHPLMLAYATKLEHFV
jgi:hypothetical protein